MNEANNKESRILKVKDIMKSLGICRDKAYALMKLKSFPATQLGKTYFVTEDNFEKWLNQNAGRQIDI